MDGPKRGDLAAAPAVAGETQGEAVDKEHVPCVEEEVDPVVPGGRVGVAEDRVIEEIGERGEGPVESAFAVRPPIGVVDDQGEVFSGGGAKSGVFEDEAAIVHRKAGGEGVGLGGERQQAKSEGDEQVASPGNVARALFDTPAFMTIQTNIASA